MATIINADTSDGLKLTSDTSGQIDFQSAGSTKATIDTSGNLKFDSGFGSVGTAYGVRAWVSFNGTDGTIQASGNVSSITDNGTGDYTVNFTTAMPDANYSVVVTAGKQGEPSGTGTPVCSLRDNSTAPTTTAVRIGGEHSTTAGAINALRINFAVFR